MVTKVTAGKCTQITQRQKNLLFLLEERSLRLPPLQFGCSSRAVRLSQPQSRLLCVGSLPHSPFPYDIPAGQPCCHVARGCDFTQSSATSLGISTNRLRSSCTRKGQMEEVLLRGTATHLQTQESGEQRLPRPVPDPLHSWCIREGSRWWPCRVNSVGARQLPQPGISLWTDAIHCAVCWLLGCTFPTAAQRPACRALCLRLLQALNRTESKAGH